MAGIRNADARHRSWELRVAWSAEATVTTQGSKASASDGALQYLDCGDGYVDLHRRQVIKSHTHTCTCMCTSTHANTHYTRIHKHVCTRPHSTTRHLYGGVSVSLCLWGISMRCLCPLPAILRPLSAAGLGSQPGWSAGSALLWGGAQPS